MKLRAKSWELGAESANEWHKNGYIHSKYGTKFGCQWDNRNEVLMDQNECGNRLKCERVPSELCRLSI